MKLFGPVPLIVEKREIVRKRTFNVRSIDEVAGVLEKLRGERFVGSVKFNIGQGGVPSSIEAEERAKV